MFNKDLFDSLVPSYNETGRSPYSRVFFYYSEEYINGTKLYEKALQLSDWKERCIISQLDLNETSLKALLNVTDEEYLKIVSAVFLSSKEPAPIN